MTDDDPEDIDDGSSPDLGDDDYATAPSVDDLDEETAAEIANDVAAESSAEADDDSDEGSETPSQDVQDVAESVAEGDVSVGHVYCRSLGLGAAALANRYDDASDDEMEALIDEYAALAKQTDLDQYMDQWFEQQTGRAEMSPGQGVVVGTLLFVAMVAIQNPAIADGLATEVGL